MSPATPADHRPTTASLSRSARPPPRAGLLLARTGPSVAAGATGEEVRVRAPWGGARIGGGDMYRYMHTLRSGQSLNHIVIDIVWSYRTSHQLTDHVWYTGEGLYVNAMPAGYISLHADLLIHGSAPNLSTTRRRCGLTLRYCAADARPLGGDDNAGRGTFFVGFVLPCRGGCKQR